MSYYLSDQNILAAVRGFLYNNNEMVKVVLKSSSQTLKNFLQSGGELELMCRDWFNDALTSCLNNFEIDFGYNLVLFDYEVFRAWSLQLLMESNMDFSVDIRKTFKQFNLFLNTDVSQSIKTDVIMLIIEERERLSEKSGGMLSESAVFKIDPLNDAICRIQNLFVTVAVQALRHDDSEQLNYFKEVYVKRVREVINNLVSDEYLTTNRNRLMRWLRRSSGGLESISLFKRFFVPHSERTLVEMSANYLRGEFCRY